MAKFVITHRLAGKATAALRTTARASLDNLLKQNPKLKVVNDNAAGAAERRSVVVEAEEDQMKAIRKGLSPDVIIEPWVKFRPHSAALAKRAAAHAVAARVRGRRMPLESARLTVLCTDKGALSPLPPVLTGATGKAAVGFTASDDPAFVVAEPAGAFWGVFSEFRSGPFHFECPVLPADGPHQWWHEAVGIEAYYRNRGKGLRIGVVGTGVGPHPCLKHVKRIDGKRDAGRHETHVAGILGARPTKPGQFAGIVPGAEIFSACFYKPAPGAEVEPEHQGVLASKIDLLARPQSAGGYGVHLLNLSFGSDQNSLVLRDAIRYAFEQGVLCICSAGNNMGGPLDYPAALPETVAVAALGRRDWGPQGSITSHWVPPEANRFGKRDLFLASMSSTGKGLTCAAPGSGIISTMPAGKGLEAPYASMDGTSMASPMACGVLAALLSTMPDYLAMSPTAERAKKAKAVLRKHCTSIGLAKEFEGAGLPAI